MKSTPTHLPSFKDLPDDHGDSLTYAVIGKAMQGHSDLGPGLGEVLYHDLLSLRLRSGGLEHQSKLGGKLVHRGTTADEFECDLWFKRGLIAELKVLSGPDTFSPEHFAQLICYLKFWRIGTGLFLDFGKERLIYRRVAYTEKPVPSLNVSELVEQAPRSVTDRDTARNILESIARIAESHGLGYRDTTYRGLIAADLTAEGISFINHPVSVIRIDGRPLGEAQCNCFVIGGKAALLILALRDHITTTDRAILQTYLKHLDLPWGLVVNFGKRSLDLMFVGQARNSQTCSP